MGLFDWLRGSRNAEPPPDELIEEMRVTIVRDIAAGFMTLQEVVDATTVIYSDGYRGASLLPVAKELADEAYESLRQAQEDWPDVTDCDRLDQAFDALEEAGIVARQNFTCCGTCGAYEIGDEIIEARDAGVKVRGYTFYHMQDTESAAEGYGLCLNYGSVEEGESDAIQIANEIVETIQRHGLQTKWDGRLERRIQVDLDWKRRATKK